MGHKEAMEMIEHNEEEFEVLKRWKFGDMTVLEVDYPNCPMRTKIMVFKGNAPTEEATVIHPHFGKENSPCARFDPKQDGWSHAQKFALKNATQERDKDPEGGEITSERVCRVLEAMSLLEVQVDNWSDLVYRFTHLASEKICSHDGWAKEFFDVEKDVLKAMEAK